MYNNQPFNFLRPMSSLTSAPYVRVGTQYTVPSSGLQTGQQTKVIDLDHNIYCMTSYIRGDGVKGGVLTYELRGSTDLVPSGSTSTNIVVRLYGNYFKTNTYSKVDTYVFGYQNASGSNCVGMTVYIDGVLAAQGSRELTSSICTTVSDFSCYYGTYYFQLRGEARNNGTTRIQNGTSSTSYVTAWVDTQRDLIAGFDVAAAKDVTVQTFPVSSIGSIDAETGLPQGFTSLVTTPYAAMEDIALSGVAPQHAEALRYGVFHAQAPFNANAARPEAVVALDAETVGDVFDSDASNVKVVRADGTEVTGIDTSGALLNDVYLVLNGIYYKAQSDVTPYNTVQLSGSGVSDDGTVTKGSVTATVKVNRPAVLLINQYDASGMLLCSAASDAVSNQRISVTMQPQNVQNSTLKVLLLDSLDGMQPLAPHVELPYVYKIDLLIVGNSFSRDTTYYLHDIAEQCGSVPIDLYLFYKGGASLTHHWDTRETADNVNILYINGESQGYTNLKSVLTSGVQFDYIALQHYIGDPDTEPESEWTPVMENLTEYVHGLAPEAEIIFHEIWSFEQGNNYPGAASLTDETQAAASAYLSEMTDRVTASAGERIGTGKLRVINSNDLFQLARHYEDENGLRVLGGTYPRDKIRGTFYSTGNYNGYSVGQGLMKDEEEAAGMVRLNRDGFHASLLGRYMMGCMWYECLTGTDARTISFTPAPESILTEIVFADTVQKAYVNVRYETPSAANLELVRSLAHQIAAASEWAE